nr:hypothetical protein [Tanacetum cinerariifolium]
MRDENLIRTLGDYSKPSHGGYKNTIELPVGNNVVPLRSDTIRLRQNGCSFHGLRSEDPNQHLKDFWKRIRLKRDKSEQNRIKTDKNGKRGKAWKINNYYGTSKKNQHEAKPKEMLVWSHGRKVLGVYGYLRRHTSQPAKTKDIAKIQSPRTWGEMQTLAGELAALNRFLSRSAEKSLPFFESLKDITKKNKHDYRWTEKAEGAFQELKKMVLDLPALTKPLPKETLIVYLMVSQEVVSAILLVIRQGRQHPVHYVSKTLHDAEQNYDSLEKMAQALRKVSTVLVELAAYNITYEPRSAVKGQILADFINEVPVGSDAMVPRQTQYTIDHDKDRKEEWVLYTDGAASAKGFGGGLVLIGPTKTEYTYALRLNFKSTNNQAEYEDLLAGLRIAKKIGVQSLSVNVDSKLVASQINGNFGGNDVPSMDVEEINVIVEEEGETWMTPIINCLERGIWPEDQNEARALRMKINPLPNPQVAQNTNDLNHGPLSLLPMGDGCAGTIVGSFRKDKVCNCGCELLYKMDRGQTANQNDWEGGKKVYMRQHCLHINTAVAHPQANGLVERANRSLMEGIKTRLGIEKKGWVDEPPNVLWAHRTSLKTSNGETPYSLTFGSEAVIPAEIGMPTHRTMMIKEESGNEEEMRLNFDLLT